MGDREEWEVPGSTVLRQVGITLDNVPVYKKYFVESAKEEGGCCGLFRRGPDSEVFYGDGAPIRDDLR